MNKNNYKIVFTASSNSLGALNLFASKKGGANKLIFRSTNTKTGVYNSYNEIDFDKLPKEFVIKATHTSGDVIIIKDKDEINHEKLKKTIEKWLKTNYFYINREWPYKNVKPRIIIEKYMVDESNIELKDYNFFCFNGNPKYLYITSGRNNKKN